MKTKENKNIKDKNSNKIKRQVSIITVFLWIFLVVAMITIVIGNIKNTNSLENDNVKIYENDVGSYVILREYYRGYNLIAKVTDSTISEISAGTTIGVLSDNNIVDIAIELLPKWEFYNVEGKNLKFKYIGNSGNIVIEENKTKEITLKYVIDEENEYIDTQNLNDKKINNIISSKSSRIGSSTIPQISSGSGPYFLQVIYINYDKTKYTYGTRIATDTTKRSWYYLNRPAEVQDYKLIGWQTSHYHGTDGFLTRTIWPIWGYETTSLMSTSQYQQTVTLNSGEGVYLIYQSTNENEESVIYTYNLTYDYNGGKVEEDISRTNIEISQENKQVFYEDASGYGSPKPQRKGFWFKGWKYEGNGVYNEFNGQIIMNGIENDSVSGTLIAEWIPTGETIAPKREDLYNILGNFVKVHCVKNMHDDKFYSIWDGNLDGLYEASIGEVYYSEEQNKLLCDLILNGEVYSYIYGLAPSFGSNEIHHLVKDSNFDEPAIYDEDTKKIITLYYDENVNKWKKLDEIELPIVFNVTCNLAEVKGYYKVKHEYYLKDKNDNLISEGVLDLGVVNTVFKYGERIIVGVSEEFDKVKIDVDKIFNYNIDNVNYKYEYLENSGNILLEPDTLKEITLKYVREEENETNIKVEKVWEDENNKYGKRPESVVLQIKNEEELVAEMKVSEENNWRCEFVVPKYDSDGNEIEYAVDEKETDVNYEKIIDGYKVINKYKKEKNENNENNIDIMKNEENVGTLDINIWMYVLIVIVSIMIIVVVIILLKKNNKKVNKS